MVTIAEGPEPEPTNKEKAVEAARNIIAGHPDGGVRRIVLYITLAVTLMAALAIDGWGGIFIGCIALVALLLLAMTDQLA